jgi:hypothetical protein
MYLGKWLNISIPEKYTLFYDLDKCKSGECKSLQCLVLTECIQELGVKISSFLGIVYLELHTIPDINWYT